MQGQSVDEILERLAAEGTGVAQPAAEVVRARPEIQKVRYTHEAMIELIIANPAVSQGELARHFGYSDAWVSTVVNSDAFKAKLALVKEELINPEIRMQINEKFRALANRSVQVLMEKLSKPVDQISDQIALRAAELGAKALGLGGNAPAMTTVITSEDRLQGLAHRLTGLMKGQGGIVDVEVREVNK